MNDRTRPKGQGRTTAPDTAHVTLSLDSVIPSIETIARHSMARRGKRASADYRREILRRTSEQRGELIATVLEVAAGLVAGSPHDDPDDTPFTSWDAYLDDDTECDEHVHEVDRSSMRVFRPRQDGS